MIKLDFPEYQFKLRQGVSGTEIFDCVRRKYISLTPEEWVRQHVVHFLNEEKQVPLQRMNVELSLVVLKTYRRADVIVFNNFGKPAMIVECKAPTVKITQKTFDQIARYNIAMKTSFLMVTNGLQHYCCFIDFENNDYRFLEETPTYQDIISAVNKST